MTTKFFTRLTIVGLFMLTVAACSSKKTTDYTLAIPSDAKAVMALNLESLADKAGGDADNSLRTKLINAMKSGLKAETLAQLEKILKDPAESGITLKEKVFTFSTPANKFPLFLAKVEDESKLQKTFELLEQEQMAAPLTKADGYSYTTLNRNTLCIFNSSALLITLAGDDGQIETLSGYLKNEGNQPQSEKLTQMLKKKGDMLFYTAYDAIPKEYTRQLSKEIPTDINLDNLSLIGDLRFEKGQLTLEFNLFASDDKTKAYINKHEKDMGKIKGSFMSNFPAATLAYISFNVDGKKLYSLLEENPEVKKQLSENKDAAELKGLLESFTGDISMGLTNVSMNSMPTFVAYAEADKKHNLNSLYEKGLVKGATKLGDNEFAYNSRTINLFYGYKNDFIYMTNDQSLYKNTEMKNAQSLMNNSYASNAKGKKLYMVVDVDNILQLPMVKMLAGFGGKQFASYFDVASRISYLEITGEESNKWTINLMMKDRESNVMKQIVDLGRAYAGL